MKKSRKNFVFSKKVSIFAEKNKAIHPTTEVRGHSC